VASWIMVAHIGKTDLYLPFFSKVYVPLGPIYFLFSAFVIVGAGNAVNLTDGLDGLATMPVIIAAGTFAIIAYLVGRVDYAAYLGIPHVPRAGDLAIFCAAIMGAVWPSCGSMRRRRLCSWVIPGRWRLAALWARLPWPAIMKSFWALWAACLCWKPYR
jgi:hypothetical protein